MTKSALDIPSGIPCRSGDLLWKDGFPLLAMRYDHTRSRPMHSHDFCELVIVTSGSCRHTTPAGSYDISAGDVFLIRPGTAHSYTAVSDFSLVNLLYSSELFPLCDLGSNPGYQALFVLEPELRLPGGSYRHLKLDRETLLRIEGKIERLEDALDHPVPGHRFRALTVFMDLVWFLAQYFTAAVVPEEQNDLLRLGRLLGFLEEHYRDPLTLAEIARSASISEVTLYRLFLKGVGEAPIAYLNRIRVEHARALLLNTRLPMAEISARSGFADSNYFSRCFRKFTGCSPREFRQNSGTLPPNAKKRPGH